MMTWRARFRILGLLHVLAGMSPSPQPISSFFLSPAPSHYEGHCARAFACASLNVQALPRSLGLPGAAGCVSCWCNLLLGVSPGEEAHTGLEGNSRTPGCMVWETEGDWGWCVGPFVLLTLPPWGGNSREGPDGGFEATPLLMDPTLPNGNGQVAKEIPWGEDDVSNASMGRGQSSHSSRSRPVVSHTLIPGLRGKGGTWKMREKRIAFEKKTGLWREQCEKWCLECSR